MNKTPEAVLKEPYARVLVPEGDGSYTAEIVEFRGCFAEGETAEEALRNLERAAESWIEAAISQGQEIPPPVSENEYSGRINLRLPRSIHRQAAAFAERNDVSLNQFFTSAISASVGAEAFCEQLIRKMQSCGPLINISFQEIQNIAFRGVQFQYEFLTPSPQSGMLKAADSANQQLPDTPPVLSLSSANTQ